MSKVKIELNWQGVRDLLKSQEMQGILEEHANNIAKSAGSKVKSFVASSRAIARVQGDDGKNGLLKAVRKK